MQRKYQVLLWTFGGSMVILAAFLWMPMLAGPDGLERVLFNLTGNEEYEQENDINYEGAPLPDYGFPIGENTYIQSWIVGLIGGLITALCMYFLFKVVKLRSSPVLTEPDQLPQ
ncbi:MAG: PDGLE domain-containing protein [Promethearchaeota archaeon]